MSKLFLRIIIIFSSIFAVFAPLNTHTPLNPTINIVVEKDGIGKGETGGDRPNS
jgi:hypothetical protein